MIEFEFKLWAKRGGKFLGVIQCKSSIIAIVIQSIKQSTEFLPSTTLTRSFNILSKMFTVLSNKFKKCLFEWTFSKAFLWSGNLWLCSSVTEFYCFSKFLSSAEFSGFFFNKSWHKQPQKFIKKNFVWIHTEICWKL